MAPPGVSQRDRGNRSGEALRYTISIAPKPAFLNRGGPRRAAGQARMECPLTCVSPVAPEGGEAPRRTTGNPIAASYGRRAYNSI